MALDLYLLKNEMFRQNTFKKYLNFEKYYST